MKLRKFYYADCKKPFLPVKFKMFTHGPLPILWHNQGLYGLIPAAVIANCIQLCIHDDILPLDLHQCNFMWDQTTPVPPEIGKQLFNEQLNKQADSSES